MTVEKVLNKPDVVIQTSLLLTVQKVLNQQNVIIQIKLQALVYNILPSDMLITDSFALVVFAVGRLASKIVSQLFPSDLMTNASL